MKELALLAAGALASEIIRRTKLPRWLYSPICPQCYYRTGGKDMIGWRCHNCGEIFKSPRWWGRYPDSDERQKKRRSGGRVRWLEW